MYNAWTSIGKMYVYAQLDEIPSWGVWILDSLYNGIYLHI